MKREFDVIVVGGGHAGTEAALASARAGADTLLLTHNIGTVGELSCNPAIGGIGKGHLVKEIDAMGGAMAKAADRAGIQFRTLNASKGSAVRATRCQADRLLYKQAIHEIVSEQSQLQLFMEAVDDLLLEGDRVVGVLTESGLTFSAKTVVLTTGTFLNGKIHVGMESHAAGRVAEKPSLKLAQRLRDLPFRVERLKTGTPPRIDARSIDFSKLAEQPGDEPRPVFSFMGSHADHPKQVPCHITYTNETTHDIIRNSLDRSPLYAGIIDGIGPRYCPSIEDKIVRFADKQRHQIFLEPEGLSSSEIYPNGISTSLPFDVQVALLHSMDGLENAWITRAGYAIEYDFFDPRDLRMSLESKLIEGLYMAGQINGTTGYEEAGAQGLLAGANAALAAQQKSPIILERSQAYMGVLVDDLIKDGTKEPYRMFTSRAEHRLLLREDNADQRLTELAHQYQLVDETRWRAFNTKMDAVADEKQRLQGLSLKQSDLPAGFNDTYSIKPLSRAYKASELMTRPELGYDALMQVEKCAPAVSDPQVAEQVEIQFKYQGYIERQQLAITKQENQQHKALPLDLDYTQVKGLSNEVRQKLKEVRPESIAQAGRISGVTPAAIAILLVHMKKHSAQQSLK